MTQSKQNSKPASEATRASNEAVQPAGAWDQVSLNLEVIYLHVDVLRRKK